MTTETDNNVPRQRKQELARILTDLATLGEDIGLSSVARDIRDIRLPKLDEERLSVVVLGEFNHGKSTFLNALLGEDLLPVGATPTTGTLCQIRHGSRFLAEAVWNSGKRKKISRKALDGWLRGKTVANSTL